MGVGTDRGVAHVAWPPRATGAEEEEEGSGARLAGHLDGGSGAQGWEGGRGRPRADRPGSQGATLSAQGLSLAGAEGLESGSWKPVSLSPGSAHGALSTGTSKGI